MDARRRDCASKPDALLAREYVPGIDAREGRQAMRSALLVAGNFVRENRWPVLLLMLWGIASGIAAAFSVRGSEEDALYFLKQQAAYNVFFSVFLAASALNTQRRTRRILAVLAK